MENKRLLAALCLLIVTVLLITSASAQGTSSSSSTCGRTAELFTDGQRHGTLNSERSKNTYIGPSIICDATQKVTPNTKFIVLGERRSMFGQGWYFIHLSGSGRKLWMPSKYVSLGELVQHEYPSETITPLPLVALMDLNVRSCPNTLCDLQGTLTKDQEYFATQRAENGWYFFNINDDKSGWASNKYLESTGNSVEQNRLVINSDQAPVSGESETVITESVSIIEKPNSDETTSYVPTTPSKPTFDPCSVRPRITYYKEKRLWHLKEPLNLKRVPHAQCGREFDLELGKVLVPLGETDQYYMLAGVPNMTTEVGYLDKSLFRDQYVPKTYIDSDVDVLSPETANYMLEREVYWNSFRYQIDMWWWRIKTWFDQNTGTGLSLIATLLGALLLIPTFTRRRLLKADQILIRGGYFFIRSSEFWRMLRRLGFILSVSAVCLFALVTYVIWLKEVANYRQMAMGLGSLGLMSLSVGMFGARVAGFFSGVVLFFLSLIEFLVFTLILCALFLLPSLLLLLWYYYSYRKSAGMSEPTAPFNNEEIERLHERIFRLRNFYPETVIRWMRGGSFKERRQWFKDVMRARTNVFDSFFTSVDRKANQAS